MSTSCSKAEIAAMEKRLFDQITSWRKVKALRPYGMCKILPNLFLGSIFDATDPEQMDANEVTDIICVHGMRQTKYGEKPYNVFYININDSPGENISAHFYDAIVFIHEARLKKRTVLVHCLAGVSRSASIIAAYLVAITNLNYPLALTYVTKRRPCADPNFGFRMQLYRFANESVLSVRKQLTEKFGRDALEDQRKSDHASIIALSDSLTKAELSKKSIDSYEGSMPAQQIPPDGGVLLPPHIADFKDICFIDE